MNKAIYEAERPAPGVRGSYLAYRSDVWHRGAAFGGAKTARFTLGLCFRRADHEWIGYDTQQSRSTGEPWTQFDRGLDRPRTRPVRLSRAGPPHLDRRALGRDGEALPRARPLPLEGGAGRIRPVRRAAPGVRAARRTLLVGPGVGRLAGRGRDGRPFDDRGPSPMTHLPPPDEHEDEEGWFTDPFALHEAALAVGRPAHQAGPRRRGRVLRRPARRALRRRAPADRGGPDGHRRLGPPAHRGGVLAVRRGRGPHGVPRRHRPGGGAQHQAAARRRGLLTSPSPGPALGSPARPGAPGARMGRWPGPPGPRSPSASTRARATTSWWRSTPRGAFASRRRWPGPCATATSGWGPTASSWPGPGARGRPVDGAAQRRTAARPR